MTIFNKIFGAAAVVLAFGFMSSCSNEEKLDEPAVGSENTVRVGFVKAPEVKAWSGTQNLDGTRADVAEENRTNWPENFEPAEDLYNEGHVAGIDEVEVNLAVNHTHDYIVGEEEENAGETVNLNDLVTKLSLHVRYGHDVKVRIPVPAQYVVPVDDMAIVLQHQQDAEAYKAQPEDNFVTYNVNGHEVKLHIAFYETAQQESEDFAEAKSDMYKDGYICVWTEGINQEVIDYLYETYGDGINFEVWNYYNKPDEVVDETVTTYPEMTESELYQYVNHSSVEFSIDENIDRIYRTMPDAYINAFMLHESEQNRPNGERVDAFVYITGESALAKNWSDNHTSQRTNYVDGYKTGYHLNGSPFNHVYNRKPVQLPPVPVY